MNQESNPQQRNPFDQMLKDYWKSKNPKLDRSEYSHANSVEGGAPDIPTYQEYRKMFDGRDPRTGSSYVTGSALTWISLIRNLWQTGDVSQAFDMYRHGNGYLPDTETAADQLKSLWEMMAAQSNSDRDFARNTPSAQLQRLLATGMSREAALQALQGFESSAAPLPEGTAPSAEELARQQANSAIAQNAINGIGLVLSTVSTATAIAEAGISLSKLHGEKAILEASAENSEMALEGAKAAAELSNAVTQTVGFDGKPLPADSVPQLEDGYDNFRTWLQSPDSNRNPYVASFKQRYPHIGDNPYFWQSARNNYNAWHTSRNQDELDKQNKIQTELIGLQRGYQQLQFDIASLDFDYQSDTYEDRVNQVAVALGIAQQTQSNLAVEGEILGEQLGITKTQNKRSRMEFADYSKVHNVMNDANLAEFKLKCDRLTALRNPRLIRKEVESLIRDYQFQATKAYFDDIEYQYERGYLADIKNDPKLQQSLMVSHMLHYYFDGYGTLGSSIGRLNAVGQVITALTPESAFGVNSMRGSGRRFNVQ